MLAWGRNIHVEWFPLCFSRPVFHFQRETRKHTVVFHLYTQRESFQRKVVTGNRCLSRKNHKILYKTHNTLLRCLNQEAIVHCFNNREVYSRTRLPIKQMDNTNQTGGKHKIVLCRKYAPSPLEQIYIM